MWREKGEREMRSVFRMKKTFDGPWRTEVRKRNSEEDLYERGGGNGDTLNEKVRIVRNEFTVE